MTAVERWAEQLDAWAIPQELLDSAEESPYGWPQSMWRRRTEMSRRETTESETTRLVRHLAGAGGSVIDVGAGRGRASLPLAAEGHPLTAVEPDAAMAGGLREDAAEAGIAVEVIGGRWPDVSPLVGPAAVVMSAHVVYDCREIGPFLRGMHDKATSAVVIEMTPTHPLSSLGPLFRTLHGIERPHGPTVDDLIGVVTEVIGVEPRCEHWSRGGQMWFADWDEVIEYYGRRLVMPRARRPELRPILQPEVVEVDGRIFIGDETRRLATVWWTSSS